jgi:hypothetical protein
MDAWPITQGLDTDLEVTLRRTDGTALTDVYAGTETFTLSIWPGDDREAYGVTSCTAVWIDSDAATVRIHLDADDTTDFPLGKSSLLLTMLDGGDSVPAYECKVRVRPVAGTSDADASYIDIGDLTRVCPWIEELQDEIADQTGFAEQCAEASEEFDELLHRNFRGNASNFRCESRWMNGSSLLKNEWLTTALAAGQLLATKKIKRAIAYHALGAILEPMVGSRGKATYQELASFYFGKAASLLATITAEIDTDSDGQGDVAIDLSNVRVLRG